MLSPVILFFGGMPTYLKKDDSAADADYDDEVLSNSFQQRLFTTLSNEIYTRTISTKSVLTAER